MESTLTATPQSTRQSPAALGTLTAGILIGVAFVLTYIQVGVFGFVPPLTIFALVALIVAALIAVGWRWTPLLGAGLSLTLLILDGQPMLEAITQPSVQGPMFAVSAVMLPLLAIGIGAGIAATIQNYRHAAGDRHTPHGLATLLTLLAGLVAGAILVALAPHVGMAAGINPETFAALPTLAAKNWAFDQKAIHVKVGETVALRLTNADPEAHYFDVDELNVHAPIPAHQTGLAIFKPTTPGTYLFYCHPHTDKATGAGMVGTLVVEP